MAKKYTEQVAHLMVFCSGNHVYVHNLFVTHPYCWLLYRMLFTIILLIHLHLRKLIPGNSSLQAKLENVKMHSWDLNQKPSAYRADALTAALWCSSQPQLCKPDISPACSHLLETHTNQVGPRPQTSMWSAMFLVKLPSWLTFRMGETDSWRDYEVFQIYWILRPHND